MINFSEFTLDNGLRVIHYLDKDSPFLAMNILYDVGARDEDPEQTGFAHLFEHLMFGGSVNIPDYDQELQKAGGINNAYTTNDITNYYLRLPAENAETAFWLESDRMLSLAFSPKSLEVQRKVVVEEFKENYLNKPYGDVWQIMRKMIYKKHPYRWMTIGSEISHIENAKLDDVKSFFEKYYRPSNAYMALSGNISLEEAKRLSEKWFGPIPAKPKPVRNLPQEPRQDEVRTESVHRDVPNDALYKAYPMSSRLDENYYCDDLISDLLGNGQSSRLYTELVKKRELFSSLGAYQMGSLDEGILVISGMTRDGVDLHDADAAVDEELEKFQNEIMSDRELQKVKNKVKSSLVFEEMDILATANKLSWSALLGDTNLVNTEIDHYDQVKAEDIQKRAREIFRKDNSNTLYYLSEQN